MSSSYPIGAKMAKSCEGPTSTFSYLMTLQTVCNEKPSPVQRLLREIPDLVARCPDITAPNKTVCVQERVEPAAMICSHCAIIPGLDLFVVIGKKRVQFCVKNLRITRQIFAYICTLAIIIHSKIDFGSCFSRVR